MRRLTYQIAVYDSSRLAEIVIRDNARDAWHAARRVVRKRLHDAGLRLDPTYFGQGWYQTRNRAGYGCNRFRAVDMFETRPNCAADSH